MKNNKLVIPRRGNKMSVALKAFLTWVPSWFAEAGTSFNFVTKIRRMLIRNRRLTCNLIISKYIKLPYYLG